MGNELDDLFLKYNSDKSSAFHNYSDPYYRFWKDLRNEPICLVELGVLDGASIRAWYDFFPRARIVGVDINEVCRSLENERLFIEVGSQTDMSFLRYLYRKHKTFNIIIDDASHIWSDQKTSFAHLFENLSPGGWYVIEDLSTSYLKGSVWDSGEPNTVDFLKCRLDDLNLNGKSICGVREVAGKELNYYEKWVEFMFFFKGIVFIKKRKAALNEL